MARIRIAVEAEFRRSTPQRTRPWPLLVLAAGLAALVFAALLLRGPRPDAPIVVASVERVEAGSLLVRAGLVSSHEAAPGESLLTGALLEAQGNTLLALAEGGLVRIAAGSRVRLNSPAEIELLQGKAYLDFPEGSAAFRVRFDAVTVEHIGTQFEIAEAGASVRVRVREGLIRVSGPRGSSTAAVASEIVVSPDGTVAQRRISTFGDEWAWAESIAPEFEIENRPLYDFLTWVARETGRHVEFADDRARAIALRTQLHGSVRGLRPLQALDRVIVTTTLRFELHGDAIRVSSRP